MMSFIQANIKYVGPICQKGRFSYIVRLILLNNMGNMANQGKLHQFLSIYHAKAHNFHLNKIPMSMLISKTVLLLKTGQRSHFG